MRKREDVSKAVQEGLESYAATQSTVQLSLAIEFWRMWKSPLEDEEALTTTQKSDSTPTANDNDNDSGEEEGDDGGDYTAMADDEEEDA